MGRSLKGPIGPKGPWVLSGGGPGAQGPPLGAPPPRGQGPLGPWGPLGMVNDVWMVHCFQQVDLRISIHPYIDPYVSNLLIFAMFSIVFDLFDVFDFSILRLAHFVRNRF